VVEGSEWEKNQNGNRQNVILHLRNHDSAIRLVFVVDDWSLALMRGSE